MLFLDAGMDWQRIAILVAIVPVVLGTTSGSTPIVPAHYAALPHEDIGSDCDTGAVDPCGCGNASAACDWMKCTKIEAQTTQCSIQCRKDSNDCDAWGSDLQCLIVETGASTGLCAEVSLLWIVGMTFSLAGSLVSNFGMQIQKVAFNRHEADVAAGKTKRKIPFCIPLWVAGFSGMVTGSLLDFASLVFAAQSLLAPLAAVTLIINICQAPLIVGEKPKKFDIACTIMIAIGCTLAVAFANHDTRTYSLQEMLELWLNGIFIVWVSIVLILMFIAWLIIQDGHRPLDESRRHEPTSLDNPSKIEKARETGSNFYPFIFCALGGQSGGNSILFAKALGEVVKNLFEVGLSFTDLLIALGMGVGLFCCMYVQLKYMNQGLRMFDVLFVLPIYQAFWISSATVNGILFFEEYINFDALQFIMFPVGCVLTIMGVAALSLKFKQSAAQNQDSNTNSDTDVSTPAAIELQFEKETPQVRARRLSDTNWRDVYLQAATAADMSLNFVDAGLRKQHQEVAAYAKTVAAAGGTEKAAETVAASFSVEQREALKAAVKSGSQLETVYSGRVADGKRGSSNDLSAESTPVVDQVMRP